MECTPQETEAVARGRSARSRSDLVPLYALVVAENVSQMAI